MEKEILEILTGLQPEYSFEDNVDFVDAGYLDSFAIIALIDALEKKFSVKISPLDLVPENFGSVAAIAALVRRSGA